MTGEWDRLKELVGEALELPRDEQQAFLDERLGDDPKARAEVQRLLDLATSSGSHEFLEPPDFSAEVEPESQTLGEFEIRRELGRGGMGVVYLAEQRGLGREVALKVLVESFTTTEREVERFHREARSIARLRHPGIAQVFADGVVGKTHWFAMEYVPGHDLGRELELQRVEQLSVSDQPILARPGHAEHARTVARVGLEVASALHFAHKNGLVHRDVKPGNLLMQRDGRISVVDFGIARDETLGALTKTGEVQGTPYYMSPEQARLREVKVDHRTDVYSLGVVLYELATLRRPFDGKTHADVLSKLRDAEPRAIRSWNTAIPRDLETICHQAMEKDPASRYATAGELADDLQRFLNHVAIVAKPPSAFARARRWLVRRRAKISAAGLVIGTGFLAWFLTSSAADRKLLTEVSVIADASFAGELFVRTIEPVLGEVGTAAELGQLPLRGRRFEPGFYRFVVRTPEGIAEYTRTLRAGESTTVLARSPAERDASFEDMIFVEGGVVQPRDPIQDTIALNFSSARVDDFFLDACEVSNADYRVFLEATGATPPRHWAELQFPEHAELPVVGVGLYEARDFAEWRGKRLPTYPEWTWAARGEENRLFPWSVDGTREYRGNVFATIDQGNANTPASYLAHAVPVKSMNEARSDLGFWHLFGNADELTESYLAMPVGPTKGIPWADRKFQPQPAMRVICGGNWYSANSASGQDLTVHSILEGPERQFAQRVTGFRCARSATL